MVRYQFFGVVLLALCIGLVAILMLSSSGNTTSVGFAEGKRRLVDTLGLTDLALCSEARYTRNPSQADLFSAFQDFPGSIEHFPTGSLILPGPVGFSGTLQIVPATGEDF